MTSSAMLVFADADSIRPEHGLAFYKALEGGQRDAGPDVRCTQQPGLTLCAGRHTMTFFQMTVANMTSAFLS